MKKLSEKTKRRMSIDRFWSHVDKSAGPDECWTWTASTANGYGVTFWKGKHTTAHRACWLITQGEIPEGMCVLHTCDNRVCVNPEHLELGTSTKYTRERMSKAQRKRYKDPAEIAKVRKAICRRYGVSTDPVERFWFYVDKSAGPEGCWIWTGYTVPNGYGRVAWYGRVARTHRVAWQITHGEIPQGKVIYHTCDNPSCVNPKHLRLGTQKDNMEDMVSKGRQGARDRRGTRIVRNAKLSEKEVKKIRELAATGLNQTDLARQFNVGRHTINSIVKRRAWKHVE